MEGTTNEIRFSTLWDIFKRCWIIMLAAMLAVSLLAGLLMVKLHESEYTASVKIWLFRNRVPASDGDSQSDAAYENLVIDSYNTQVSEALLPDCMNILHSNVVLDRTVRAYMAEHTDAEELTKQAFSKMAKVNTVSDTTRLLELSVTADSPEKAQALADCWSLQFQNYVNTDLMNGQSYIQIADPALLPEQESNPISVILIALIGVIAAMLVYVVALVCYLTNDKIDSAEDVEKYLELSVLGAIPNRQNLAATKKAGYGATEGERNT